MKALSVRQPWASMIAQGSKTIETRTWPTKHRGDLLIVSSKQPKIDHLPTGQALCVVRLYDCRPMTRDDEPKARSQRYEGAWAWCFANVRPVEHVHIRGTLGIYEVNRDEITADCRNCMGCRAGCDLDGLCF